MPNSTRFFWKKVPVSRLVIPFFLGIACQYYWPTPVSVLLGLALVSIGLIAVYSFSVLPFFSRFRSGFINGLSVFLLFLALGAIAVWQQDIRKRSLWLGNIYQETDALVIKLLEPPSEKQKSFKTTATVIKLIREDQQLSVKGKIYVYVPKSNNLQDLNAGDILVTHSRLQPISPKASPGAFDYGEYSLFHGITHQLFLKNDFVIVGREQRIIAGFINRIRNRVLSTFQKAFPEKRERGLAEALLIGYEDELDQTLVQSYTNTGVVHIIAISGLHLGLIYWLLVQMLQPLSRNRRLKWIGPVFIIAGLWIFTLLAGAQPSVLRSAIMFTCIVIGNSLSRRSNVLNSLAVSAFLLLCYNPFWLWDAGFQLSYAAIIGIVVFMKPIYHLLSFSNKLVDSIWQMNAVTLAAQLLTLPICIYHFHQFPNYFLISNIIAVPLSSLILLLEIFLCLISFIPFLYSLTAALTSFLIRLMNTCVERVEQLPYAVWDGLQISFLQAVFLAAFLIFLLCCLIYRDRTRMLLYAASLMLMAFATIRCISFLKTANQQMIIVYRQSADFIGGRAFASIGNAEPGDHDQGLTRSLFRLKQPYASLLVNSGNYLSFLSKRIVIIDRTLRYQSSDLPEKIDLIILSQKPSSDASGLLEAMTIRQVVADASVPAYISRRWQLECEASGIPYHDVRTKGAFVMKL
ncbi:competence protein ComEC family protein [Terrimonas sp. NA20]|uniref:Competence protein ComEC family protein n=1 Tax=Terrimonas ginsenosidimutans TaxID=2908004 RepID=A0ABS9KQ28_9BACT|nr:ComEC/Rec2 family competence protein [Terrimonas ginsenosidimutans]MCG2614433.1 competence protein ComEC family protein [Terrimonas ginsenosidimutans]